MKYLFQYTIKTDLEYENEIAFDYNGIVIRLVLNEVEIFTKSKKLQLIINAETKEQAYSIMPEFFHSAFDKMVIFTGENISIYPFPEIILLDEKAKAKRTLFFDIILEKHVPYGFSKTNLSSFMEFIKYAFPDEITNSIYFLRRAQEADHIEEIYFNTFRALESLCKKAKENRKCPNHGADLICPKCNRHVIFEHLTKENIDEILQKLDVGNHLQLDSEVLLKYRQQCAHRTKKINKKAASIDELQETARRLYLLMSDYIIKEFFWNQGRGYMPYLAGLIKFDRHTAMNETSFITNSIDQEFALDVPPMSLLRAKMESGWRPEDGI
jgi:hypothetical protein